MMRRVSVAAAVTLLLGAVSVLSAAPATGAGPSLRKLCTHSAHYQCRSEVVVQPKTPGGASTGISPDGATVLPPPPPGYYAADLQAMYHVTNVAPAGATPTIAIVDAYAYPKAESDLATYRSFMGLPPCTVASGCLKLLNQNMQDLSVSGTPKPPAEPNGQVDWQVESALDLDMASAICPDCKLVLVETNDTGDGLVNGARNASTVAHYVSMSWGGPDGPGIPSDTFVLPSTMFFGASGDNGYSSTPDFPSTYTNVVGVGGVTMTSVGATPAAWSGAGSSCSDHIPQPTVQAALSTGCTYKAASDLSAVADPYYGVAVYNAASGGPNNGWWQVGGTSAATPIVAALYAIAGNDTDPWTGYKNLSAYPALMADVTTGSNGTCGAPLCDAGASWDGPTGIGMPLTPEAVALPLADMTMRFHQFGGTYLVPFSKSVTLPKKVPDTAGTRQPLASADATVTGLPDGLTWSITNGVLTISGTPTTPGSGTATISLTGTTPAGRSAQGTKSVTWTIAKATMVPDGPVLIQGHRRPHYWVRSVLPTVYANSLSGQVVTPTWTVKWFLNGTLVHIGERYRIARHSKGDRLRVRAHAKAPKFLRLTVLSDVVRIR